MLHEQDLWQWARRWVVCQHAVEQSSDCVQRQLL